MPVQLVLGRNQGIKAEVVVLISTSHYCDGRLYQGVWQCG